MVCRSCEWSCLPISPLMLSHEQNFCASVMRFELMVGGLMLSPLLCYQLHYTEALRTHTVIKYIGFCVNLHLIVWWNFAWNSFEVKHKERPSSQFTGLFLTSVYVQKGRGQPCIFHPDTRSPCISDNSLGRTNGYWRYIGSGGESCPLMGFLPMVFETISYAIPTHRHFVFR